MKHDPQQFYLSSALPAGERMIWQGQPTFKGLALRAFHIREVAIYFGLFLMWRLWSNWSTGASTKEMAIAALWLVAPAICSVAVLAGLAWLFRRASRYTITNRRVLMQFGVALPVTMNIPLAKISAASLKTYADGSGDIPLKLADTGRASFLLLWPHVRPWRLRFAEPMLRAIPNAASVAGKLSEVLSGRPDPAAISIPHFIQEHSPSGASLNSQTSIAA